MTSIAVFSGRIYIHSLARLAGSRTRSVHAAGKEKNMHDEVVVRGVRVRIEILPTMQGHWTWNYRATDGTSGVAPEDERVNGEISAFDRALFADYQAIRPTAR